MSGPRNTRSRGPWSHFVSKARSEVKYADYLGRGGEGRDGEERGGEGGEGRDGRGGEGRGGEGRGGRDYCYTYCNGATIFK